MIGMSCEELGQMISREIKINMRYKPVLQLVRRYSCLGLLIRN